MKYATCGSHYYFSCLKSYSCVHQLNVSCPPFDFFFVTLHLHIAPSFFPLLRLFRLSLHSWPFCLLYFYVRLVLDPTFAVLQFEEKERFRVLFHCNSLCVVKGMYRRRYMGDYLMVHCKGLVTKPLFICIT